MKKPNYPQTGRRTSTFTDAEKEVTQSVILKREQIAQELEESGAINGSNGQLNLGKILNFPNTRLFHFWFMHHIHPLSRWKAENYAFKKYDIISLIGYLHDQTHATTYTSSKCRPYTRIWRWWLIVRK